MFVDLLFPDRVSRNIQSNRSANVEIIQSDSRFEQRNARGLSRVEMSVRLSVRDMTEINEIVSLWESVEGNLYSFRVRDWSQYFVGFTANGSVLAQSTPHIFAAGTGAQTTFQLVRRYVAGSVTKDRKVTKPRNDATYPVQIFVDGVELTSGWSVNYSTGVVTFASAPANTKPIAWRGVYDLAMRFDGPLPLDLEVLSIGSTGSLKLVEVFGE